MRLSIDKRFRIITIYYRNQLWRERKRIKKLVALCNKENIYASEKTFRKV